MLPFFKIKINAPTSVRYLVCNVIHRRGEKKLIMKGRGEDKESAAEQQETDRDSYFLLGRKTPR